MLKQIAKNAAIAKRNLNIAMRRTQERFAKKASLDNRRQRATNARNRKTYAIMNADRRENAKNLNSLWLPGKRPLLRGLLPPMLRSP